MQTENLVNNSHKQFYVLLNTNQIKLYSYPDLLKENPLLRKFLNSELTAYVLDATLYHRNIILFSMTISTAIVIKATKYSTYYIIHNSYDVATKYSIIIFQHDLLVAKTLKTSATDSDIHCYAVELKKNYKYCN